MPITDADIDQLRTQQGLNTKLSAYILAGQWDAATYGAQSAEAVLYALSPDLYAQHKAGTYTARPFDVAPGQ